MPVLSSRRARAAAAVLIAGGMLAATATAAQASTANTVYRGTQAYWITAAYDGLNIAVASGATWAGAPVIQWYNDGTAEQKWYLDKVYDSAGGFLGNELRNENSGMCLFNDGIAGDWMYQEPCTANNPAEFFSRGGSTGSDNNFQGIHGMYLDVNGFSSTAGANIIGWYGDSQFDQDFWVTPVSS